MSLRKVLLCFDSCDDNLKFYFIETDFDQFQLEDAAQVIGDELMDSDDGWNEDKIIDELVKRGYIKTVSRDVPEVMKIEVF